MKYRVKTIVLDSSVIAQESRGEIPILCLVRTTWLMSCFWWRAPRNSSSSWISKKSVLHAFQKDSHFAATVPYKTSVHFWLRGMSTTMLLDFLLEASYLKSYHSASLLSVWYSVGNWLEVTQLYATIYYVACRF